MTDEMLFGLFVAGGFAVVSAFSLSAYGNIPEPPSTPAPEDKEPAPSQRPIGRARGMVERQRERLAKQASMASAPHAQHGPGAPAWQQGQSQHAVADEAGSFVAWLHDCIVVPEEPDERDTIPFVALVRSYGDYCERRQFPAFQTDDFARSLVASAHASRYGYTQSGDLIGAKFRN